MKFIQIFVFGVSNWLFHTHFSTLSSGCQKPCAQFWDTQTGQGRSQNRHCRIQNFQDVVDVTGIGFQISSQPWFAFVTHHRSHFALESRWRATAVVLNSSPIVFLKSSVWRRHLLHLLQLVGWCRLRITEASWITTSVQPCSTIFKSPRVVKEPKCEAPDGGWTQVVRAVWGRNSHLYTILDPNKIEDYSNTHMWHIHIYIYISKNSCHSLLSVQI